VLQRWSLLISKRLWRWSRRIEEESQFRDMRLHRLKETGDFSENEVNCLKRRYQALDQLLNDFEE